MTPQAVTLSPRQRVKATRDHMEALVGTWELGGSTIQMVEEPESGVLLALNARGEPVNPLTVISRGSKR